MTMFREHGTVNAITQHLAALTERRDARAELIRIMVEQAVAARSQDRGNA